MNYTAAHFWPLLILYSIIVGSLERPFPSLRTILLRYQSFESFPLYFTIYSAVLQHFSLTFFSFWTSSFFFQFFPLFHFYFPFSEICLTSTSTPLLCPHSSRSKQTMESQWSVLAANVTSRCSCSSTLTALRPKLVWQTFLRQWTTLAAVPD